MLKVIKYIPNIQNQLSSLHTHTSQKFSFTCYLTMEINFDISIDEIKDIKNILNLH